VPLNAPDAVPVGFAVPDEEDLRGHEREVWIDLDGSIVQSIARTAAIRGEPAARK
jgi:hypothetical protein